VAPVEVERITGAFRQLAGAEALRAELAERPRSGRPAAAPAGRGRSERAAGAALNGADRRCRASQAVAECAKAARRGSAGRKGDDSMDAIHVGRR
jgi:hypothetical protein